MCQILNSLKALYLSKLSYSLADVFNSGKKKQKYSHELGSYIHNAKYRDLAQEMHSFIMRSACHFKKLLKIRKKS